MKLWLHNCTINFEGDVYILPETEKPRNVVLFEPYMTIARYVRVIASSHKKHTVTAFLW